MNIYAPQRNLSRAQKDDFSANLDALAFAYNTRYQNQPLVVAGDMNISASKIATSYLKSHLDRFRPSILAPHDPVVAQPGVFQSTHEAGNCLDYALVYNLPLLGTQNPECFDMPSSGHSAVRSFFA